MGGKKMGPYPSVLLTSTKGAGGRGEEEEKKRGRWVRAPATNGTTRHFSGTINFIPVNN